MHEKLQAIMTTVYDRWRGSATHMSKQEFWDGLSPNERIVVFCSNLNQQVCNGGFVQWHDNDFATEEVLDFLIPLCGSMDTKSGTIVQMLLQEFREEQATFVDSDGDDEDQTNFHMASEVLSSRFYEINDSWLRDVGALIPDEDPETLIDAVALALEKLTELGEAINESFPPLDYIPKRDQLLHLLLGVRRLIEKLPK